MQKIMSIMSLVFAFGYGIVSIIIIMSTKSMATSQADNESFDSVNVVQSSAHTDVLADVWEFLSIFSVVATAISFVAGIVSLFTEEGDRMREEGELFNLLLISAWTILFSGRSLRPWKTFLFCPTFFHIPNRGRLLRRRPLLLRRCIPTLGRPLWWLLH